MQKKLVTIAITAFLTISSAHTAGKIIVGYYPTWNKTSYPHTAIDYQNLTHIAHAFIAPNLDGTLEVPGGFLYPELIQSAHSHNVKVMVSLGGWGDYSARFAPMTADTAARRRFVQNLKTFCVTNGYDGADLDWEYPANATQRTNMKLLVAELRQAFNTVNPPLLLAMAGPATNWSGQWFDFTSMAPDFDWIGIMTYDFYGNWSAVAGPNSALYGTYPPNDQGWIDYSVQYYNATRGVPKSKLLVGIPFYGWSFNASALYAASTGASQLTYSSIAPKLQQGWTRTWDNSGRVPYMISAAGTQLISYDDTVSVAAKCSYINSNNVGGTIIWAIGQDVIGGRQVLLQAVGDGLLRTNAIDDISTQPLDFRLEQNYPNPFNGITRIRYRVPHQSNVDLKLYDMLGREVQTLAHGVHNAGEFESTISSETLTSGMYFYRLTSETQIITKSMVVLR